MRAAGGGSIVNTSSEAGLVGLARYTAYGATKWAVRGLTKTAALELAADGIRVNSVHPGIVDTPMLVDQGLFLDQGMVGMVRIGRYGVPEDIAHLVLFLASDASSYITGAEIHINGGGLAT
jgi:3alpha(or 20beta)-hydroxysteroid dehydrogenase